MADTPLLSLPAAAALAPGDAFYIVTAAGQVDQRATVGQLGALAPMGPAGPQGPQGVQGPAGAAGAQGPKGDPGTTGSQGAQGPAGPAGADGAPGAQGPKGDTGAPGAQGPQGPAGPAPAGTGYVKVAGGVPATQPTPLPDADLSTSVALKNQAALISGDWAFGNALGYCLLKLVDSDGGADAKNWGIVVDGNQLDLRLYNDAWAGVSAASVLTLTRSAMAAQLVTVRATTRVTPDGTASAPALQIGPGDANGKTGAFWDPTLGAGGGLVLSVNGRPQVGILHNTDVNRFDVLNTWNLAGPGSKLVVGRNFNGAGAAGTLCLVSRNGDAYVLWVEGGQLRIGTAAPTLDGSVSHTSGVVVGTQSGAIADLTARLAAAEARIQQLEARC